MSLQSTRHISDLAFKKEGLMVHTFKNLDPSQRTINKLVIQDHLPHHLRPLLHKLQVFTSDEHGASITSATDLSKVKVEFTETSQSLITITISKPDLLPF